MLPLWLSFSGHDGPASGAAPAARGYHGEVEADRGEGQAAAGEGVAGEAGADAGDGSEGPKSGGTDGHHHTCKDDVRQGTGWDQHGEEAPSIFLQNGLTDARCVSAEARDP